jgi:hypothetical protein
LNPVQYFCQGHGKKLFDAGVGEEFASCYGVNLAGVAGGRSVLAEGKASAFFRGGGVLSAAFFHRRGRRDGFEIRRDGVNLAGVAGGSAAWRGSISLFRGGGVLSAAFFHRRRRRDGFEIRKDGE